MYRKPLMVLAAGTVLALVVGAAPAFAQGGGLKLAVIDVQRIIVESATGKAALANLESFGKEQEAKLQSKKDEIDQLRKQISDGQLSLSEERLEELQADLEKKTIEMRRAGDDAQREFNLRRDQALKDIEKKVMPIIQQVGQEGGYTMIFRKFDSGLVYAADQVDITSAVITRLDAAGGGS